MPRREIGHVSLAGDAYLLIDCGAYDSSVTYQPGSVVVASSGLSYVALPVVGFNAAPFPSTLVGTPAPPNATYWQLFREGIGFLGADRTWKPVSRTKIIELDGLGSVISTGVWGDTAVDFDCTITGWRLAADQVGGIVVDVWKVPFADFPPTVANTITGASPPTLSSQDHAASVGVAGWATTVSAGDVFRFNVDSASTVARVLLTLALDAG